MSKHSPTTFAVTLMLLCFILCLYTTPAKSSGNPTVDSGVVHDAKADWDLFRSLDDRQASIFNVPIRDQQGRALGWLGMKVVLRPYDGGSQSELTVEFFTIGDRGWASNEEVTVELLDSNENIIRSTSDKIAWDCNNPLEFFKQTTWDKPIIDTIRESEKIRVRITGGTWNRCG